MFNVGRVLRRDEHLGTAGFVGRSGAGSKSAALTRTSSRITGLRRISATDVVKKLSSLSRRVCMLHLIRFSLPYANAADELIPS